MRDRLALLVISAHTAAWMFYVSAMVWRDRGVPEMAWGILPSGVTVLLLAVYGKDYVYRGRHYGRATD